MGFIEMGGAAGTLAGLLLGYHLHGLSIGDPLATLGLPDIPAALAAATGLNLLGVLTALPAYFPADVRRPESPARAVAGFFADSRRILRDRQACASLAGLAAFWGLLTAGSGAVLAYALRPDFSTRPDALPLALIWISVGAGLGSLLAGLQKHTRRALGLVPLGAAGLLGALAWAALSTDLAWPGFLMGIMGGVINVPLRSHYQDEVPADARGNGMAIMNSANYISSSLLAVLMFGLARLLELSPVGQLGFLAVLVGVGIVICWNVLRRETIELCAEILLWPFYRVHVHGPGLEAFPRRGPVLVVANHAAWFDPVWLGKLIPRPITPMMTSRFYDLPILRWLMGQVVHAIRVQSTYFRREAPELDEAVAALDRRDCLVIFPEGFMKRRAEQALRQFGRGIWHILSQRPATPVVFCWIEGGWGSFTSYDKGPPTKGKRLDWWRRIDVAIEVPMVLDQKLLQEQRATRAHLMHCCLATRRYLSLAPLQLEPQTDGQEDPGIES
jgi:1-acyl-sn-glycerol-3-phosphate acyltransferase